MFPYLQSPVPLKRPLGQRQKRRGFRSLFVFAVTTTMIATGGFGAFPENPLTQTFQGVINENFPEDFLNPFNSYLEDMAVPTIPSRLASSSQADSQPDPLGVIESLFAGTDLVESPLLDGSAVVETAMASIERTQTQVVTFTAQSPTSTQTLTQTSTPTLTLLPTTIQSPTPTLTLVPVVIFPIFTKTPRPAATSTSATGTVLPFLGFNVSSVDINGMGTYATVTPGGTVNVSYNFNVYDDDCPGCLTQLVTGLGSSGTHGGTCAFDGDAALAPGTPGFEDVILTAPVNPGIYSVVVEYHWQFGCTDALTAYGTGGEITQETIGQIEVQVPSTQVPASGGSCVTGSPNSLDYGCLVSNIRLDSVTQTSLTVLAGQPFTLEYDFQVWTNPGCPTCRMQLVAGIESSPAANCDYDNLPGVYPGANGGSYVQTLIAPAAPGNYAVFVRWMVHPDCATATANYSGFGSVIALITVP